MNNTLHYTEAFEELQRIVTEIEQGSISIDELSSKVKRAAELIRICQQKLHATEADVQQILKDLSKEEEGH
jgi:exodeoxyribonuclease VII small subunit